MKFDLMLIYEGFSLKISHLFQLFQFAKSELEQTGTNWNRPRNPWRTSSSPADAFGVRAEEYLNRFLPINERK